MDTQYAFRIPAHTLDTLRKIAQAQDLTVAQLMRRIVSEYVKSQGE